ncbi:serine carboxypeptidase-like enzyme [Selaginella moellendorffii]|uniref:Carboxypeptidase n=1 Tax=Selaginella moellendorffii TaxID=88036 RepID=D8QZ16_SELML|nr:serine carboxypeptidase-like 42 [Selaginella moellendorffii]EFJ34710.1 serine carboxypeptidase-like enzyme [Selaginella moellendorffii]|eukprot:XP_002964377.1 serine carboxypeptidase-like 42 [Selaginella moellendorffii]
MSRLVLLLLVIALLVLVQVKGAPESELVSRLPGQPHVSFKQYAGYVTVDKNAGRALFYYFAEAETRASSQPLTLWLNGGPGCSSIGGGAFTELGPFYPNASGQGLLVNRQAWNKVSNMLFLEAPAGVGWSYSNKSSDYEQVTDRITAVDTLNFLLGWMDKFPEYQTRDFYITGESYAGHYVPQLAELIIKHSQVPGNYAFRLKGVAIGNPLLNLAVDTSAMYEYFWSHGLISDETFQALSNSCKFEDYELGLADHNVSNACNDGILQSNTEVGRFINNYDVILDVCLPSIFLQEVRLKQQMAQKSYGVDICIDKERDVYFNLPEVQRELHANTTGLSYSWSMCTGPVDYAMQDGSTNMVPLLGDILKAGLRVWIFSGDQDSVVPLTGTRSLIGGLAKSLGMQTTQPYTAWYQGGQVAGWTQSYGNLTYATIRGAAHMVPYAQPERALLLFRSFIRGNALPIKSA